jgi:hypothetical protein
MCERAARLIGLDVCGVDLVIPDISTEMTSGGVIEINASPGLRMHHYPSAGMPRHQGPPYNYYVDLDRERGGLWTRAGPMEKLPEKEEEHTAQPA